MEAFSFLIDFFTDINVYIAGVIVYLFGPSLNRGAKWVYRKVKARM